MGNNYVTFPMSHSWERFRSFGPWVIHGIELHAFVVRKIHKSMHNTIARGDRAHSAKSRTFDIVLFCSFSLRNEVRPRTSILAGSLLVFLLSRTVVIRAGNGSEHRSEQLFRQRPPASDNVDRTVQVNRSLFYAYLE